MIGTAGALCASQQQQQEAVQCGWQYHLGEEDAPQFIHCGRTTVPPRFLINLHLRYMPIVCPF